MCKNITEFSYSDELKNAIQNEESVQSMKCTMDGEAYYCSSSYLNSIDYLVLGVMPEAEYLDIISENRHDMIFGFVFCIIVLTLLSILFAKRFVRALKKLTVATGQMADGQMDVAIDVQSNDEIDELAQNIQAIVDRLREYMAYIDEISSVLEQIAQGTQNQAQGATEQVSEAENLSDKIKQMHVDSQKNMKNALAISENTQKMGGEIKKATWEMGNLMLAIDHIAQESSEIVKIIKTIEILLSEPTSWP